ncbi:MAG: AAA domain-containing protein, partial [Bacilli bacterium]|nr:AAA domain-containing protein [Bacilli bacterium]
DPTHVSSLAETIRLKRNGKAVFEFVDVLPSEGEKYENELDTLIHLNTAYEKRNILGEKLDVAKLSAFDAVSLYSSYVNASNPIAKNLFIKSKIKRKIRSIAKQGASLSGKEAVSFLEVLSSFQKEMADYGNRHLVIDDQYMEKTAERLDLAPERKAVFEDTVALSRCLKNFDEESVQAMASFFKEDCPVEEETFSSFLEAYDSFVQREKELASYLSLDYHVFAQDDLTETYKRVLSLEDYPDDISTVAEINKVKAELAELGASELLLAMQSGAVQTVDLLKFYVCSLANSYFPLYCQNEEKVNSFNAASFERKIKDLVQLIGQYSNESIEEVSAKLSSNFVHGSSDMAASSKAGRLRRFARLSRGKPTIREAIRDYGDIVRAYFPCFLMSPLSVSQYLPLDDENFKKFDIVIFDEASQIPVHEAIGSIARGYSVIVAGDPKQMPPSSYFSTNIDIEDQDIVFEDSSSLLEECQAISLPDVRLDYHYRSRHESLIEFSNNEFYEGGLLTFPSVSSKTSEVHFRHIPLSTNKKTSAITLEEKDAIIELIREIYEDENTFNKTVGIIAFNVEQRDSIDAALSDFLEDNRDIAERINQVTDEKKEPLFIKSIDSVQGDERDIIILSVGWGKSLSGKPIVRGPVVETNGERRINVAASRSRERMYVLSTVRASEFGADENIKNRGTLAMKHLIAFAEASSFASNCDSEKANPIALSLASALEEKGYEVDFNIGKTDCGFDLAVVDRDSSTYLVGVSIDRCGLGDGATVRDLVYLRPSFMQNALGWKVVKVYPLEYYSSPKKTIERIIKALEEENGGEEAKLNPHIVSRPMANLKYRFAPYPKGYKVYPLRYKEDTGFGDNLSKNVDIIIENEAPVAYSRIKSNIAKMAGLTALSKKMENELRQVLLQRKNYMIEEVSGEREIFFWREGDLGHQILAAREAHTRTWRMIAPEEIALVIEHIRETQGELEETDFARVLLDTYGFEKMKVTAEIKQRIQNIVLNCLNNDLE